MSKKRTLITIVLGVVLAMTLGLVGCGSGSSSASEVDATAKANAKVVIKAASNLLAVSDLGLTDADSPATISSTDPAYADFYTELAEYGDVADHQLDNCDLTVSITAVTAATAREDSAQTNYRFVVTGATMTVDDQTISYEKDAGFSM